MRTIGKKSWVHVIIISALLLSSFSAKADIPAGYSVLETITYSYDVNGKRIARGATVSGTPETPIEAQYDSGNRLTQLVLKSLGPNGTDLTCTLDYDPNGNLNTKICGNETTRYIWSASNRLMSIQSPTITASFQYDALGRRIERSVNGDALQNLYDGDQAIAEIRNGAVSAHILTSLAIDENIARFSNESERTFLRDALGNILIGSKEDATVATAYGYSPYGETQVMGAEEHNSIQYTSRENDDTGLYYYRARYYDPQLKRFISEDPIGIDGGLNVYVYAANNPVMFIDPDGRLCIYQQSTGSMSCSNDVSGETYLTCDGYAGTGDGRNNPDAQDQRNRGPVPRGDYTVGTSFRHPHAGAAARRLVPASSNVMHGRDGMMIHGDNARNDASQGCIILPRRCRDAIPDGETVRVVR